MGTRDRFSTGKTLDIYLRCHGFTSDEHFDIKDERITIRLYGKDRATLTGDLADFIIYKSFLDKNRNFYRSGSQNPEFTPGLRQYVELDYTCKSLIPDANEVTEKERLEISDVRSRIKNYRMQWNDPNLITGILFLETNAEFDEDIINWELCRRYRFYKFPFQQAQGESTPLILEDLINRITRQTSFASYSKILINWTACREDEEYTLLREFLRLTNLTSTLGNTLSEETIMALSETILGLLKEIRNKQNSFLLEKDFEDYVSNKIMDIPHNKDLKDGVARKCLTFARNFLENRNKLGDDELKEELRKIISMSATPKIGLRPGKGSRTGRTYTDSVDEWLRELNHKWNTL